MIVHYWLCLEVDYHDILTGLRIRQTWVLIGTVLFFFFILLRGEVRRRGKSKRSEHHSPEKISWKK